MSNAPVYEIDLKSFWRDPYPDLKAMRESTPIAYVPQLGATLLTKRDDIFVNEKKTEYFSSDQPQGHINKYFLSYAGHCKINEAPPILEGR